MDRLTVTAAELATILGISDNLVYKEAKENGAVAGIPAIPVGRRVVFSREQVDRRLRGEPIYQRLPEPTRAAS